MGRFWKAAGGGAAGRLVEEEDGAVAVIVVPEAFLAEQATAGLLAVPVAADGAGGEDTMLASSSPTVSSSALCVICVVVAVLLHGRHKGTAPRLPCDDDLATFECRRDDPFFPDQVDIRERGGRGGTQGPFTSETYSTCSRFFKSKSGLPT